jgi:hypothetical protein
MKYQPLYLPATDKKMKEEPLFNTEKEAWDYIHKKYCQCQYKPYANGLDYCNSCEAEWMVDKIK